jgi:hypothetical protein
MRSESFEKGMQSQDDSQSEKREVPGGCEAGVGGVDIGINVNLRLR